MARRMHEQKEYYWQGLGGSDVTLGKIISKLLNRDFATNLPETGEIGDVYTLQFDFYNDNSAFEGHSIIHVPHNEDHAIVFNMVILSSETSRSIDQDTTINDTLIVDIESFEFAIYLRKIASNQPYRFDYS